MSKSLSSIVDNMIIKAKAAPARSTYDHASLAAAAVAEPGSWFSDDADDYPNTAPGQIRRGAMKDYRPAGAFTARRIDGRVHVAFLGVPKRPWDPTGEEPFDMVTRTLNPDRCPEGTPDVLLEQLHALRRVEAHQRADGRVYAGPPPEPSTPRAKKHKKRGAEYGAAIPQGLIDEIEGGKKKGKKKKAKKHKS